jgi:hypothetical protein
MRTVMYKGQRLTLREAAHVTHQPYARLRWRLDNGWTEERALETPWCGQSAERMGETRFAQAIARYLAQHPDEAWDYQERGKGFPQ